LRRKITTSINLIRDCIEEYGDDVAVACSFGKDSMVTLHLALQVKPDIKVFSVMTRFKPPETLALKKRITNEWNLNITTYESTEPLPYMCHKTNPDLCCQTLKVEPTKRAIHELGLKSWITGIRRDEGFTRSDYKHVEHYEEGIVKINPILDWRESEVWQYIAYNNIPFNPLYMEGYRSLGCITCSQPYTEEERGGRWMGTNKIGGECGIHGKMFRRIQE